MKVLQLGSKQAIKEAPQLYSVSTLKRYRFCVWFSSTCLNALYFYFFSGLLSYYIFQELHLYIYKNIITSNIYNLGRHVSHPIFALLCTIF